MRRLNVLKHAVMSAVAATPFLTVGDATAVQINGIGFTNHSHDQFNNPPASSPFFTSTLHASNGTEYVLGPSNGLAGSIKTPNGPGSSPVGPATTISGRVTITGSATSLGVDATKGTEDDWLDGNNIPSGVKLSFDASFTITAANGNNLITANGNTGDGIGVANSATQNYGAINAGETLEISAITTSNYEWSGAPTESFSFTPIAVGVTKFGAFRSPTFEEDADGATLSDGTNTWGFGLSTGTAGSGLKMENNLSQLFAPAGGDVALTLTTEAGAWNLKGFRLVTPVSYEVVPIATADADFNNDLVVDGADFLIWQRGFGAVGTATPEDGDADGNLMVDELDLALWSQAFGSGGGEVAGATAVPEPAAIALACGAALAVGWRRGRLRTAYASTASHLVRSVRSPASNVSSSFAGRGREK